MEERTLYRPILKEAWQITKNFKSLWFLGLFAAVLGGSGEFELLARIIFKPGSNQGLILGAFESFKTGIQNTLPTGADLWSNLLTLLINAPLNLISLILVLAIASFLFNLIRKNWLWLILVAVHFPGILPLLKNIF